MTDLEAIRKQHTIIGQARATAEDWARSYAADLWSMLEQYITSSQALVDQLTRERDEARRALGAVKSFVSQQADDDGLWFSAETAAEGYLQSELRRLHAFIEGKSPEDCANEAIESWRAAARAGK